MVWAPTEVVEGGGTWGAYPKGFLAWAMERMGRPDPSETLHVCSGGLGPATPGIRVDIRPEVLPDVVADGRALPFPDRRFRAVLLDPPYSVEYAESLYQTEYPRPAHLLAEAARVTRPLGLIGFVHFLVPNPPPDTRFERVIGIHQGCGYRIRALTLYRKRAPGLPFQWKEAQRG